MVKIIAHKGNSISAPENTCAAFLEAVALGVDSVEFDVHITKDGIPVVIHDYDMSEMTQGQCIKEIKELTLSEIKEFDIGSHRGEKYRGERVPTLEETLSLPWGHCELVVEIKSYEGKHEELVNIIKPVVKRFSDANPAHPIAIESTDLNILHLFKEYTTVHVVDNSMVVEDTYHTDIPVASVHRLMVTKREVKILHDLGKKIWIWTVNNPHTVKKKILWDIDGIFTDDPAMALRVKRSLSARDSK